MGHGGNLELFAGQITTHLQGFQKQFGDERSRPHFKAATGEKL
jgi:hypothetical protein